MKTRKHMLITGTGRTGTSFILELLTNLGFDTGFLPQDLKEQKDAIGRAGFEKDIRLENCPYIVKNPWFCEYADEVFLREDIIIEHIFIPIRNLNAAAQSRIHVTESGIGQKSGLTKAMIRLGIKKPSYAGGLWHTQLIDKDNQEYILQYQMYKLMLSISSSDTNVSLIRFPLLTQDPDYLFKKLNPIVKNLEYDTFLDVFKETVKPELVNRFNSDDN